ncbi:glycogen debranching protein GlgX [Myxococcota bacterium]|nr:glycogen debranching protein GlgX [Myxococcota bacterium]
MKSRLRLRNAPPLPLGVTPHYGGVRFALFSRRARRVAILLFDSVDDIEPSKVLELDPEKFRFGDIWSVFVEGIEAGQAYAYQLDGPWDPLNGQRYDRGKYLIDPYAKSIAGPYDWHRSQFEPHQPPLPMAPKSIVVSSDFPWKRDRPMHIPMEETVIYEVHLKGFTAHPSSGVSSPGTFKGFKEMIPWIKSLGVTSVEFLPLQAFPANENIHFNPDTGERLTNYWGYSTMAFMAPHAPYASDQRPGAEINEFRELVSELHEAGLEVIMDVVFNHTAEGNETGPTLSFRGIEDNVYYMVEPGTGAYRNYSGCGNTVNCNHPVVRDFILDVLRYWVVEMHVDGFRFDLASILGRDQEGNLLDNPPLVERISADPILRGVKIIAEAWDAGGAYQVGSFPGTRWAEWNGRYRDDIRHFWLKKGSIRELATRLAGSEDLYGPSGRTPLHSINFVTCHDGFTLRDLVSYNEKHNLANGENNMDGDNNNLSNNHGVEGECFDPAMRKARLRTMKNLLTTLMVSQGVPMILAGDEAGRTQKGNNNCYCQDNPLSWIDWRLMAEETPEQSIRGYRDPLGVERSEGQRLAKFTKYLISLRKSLRRFGTPVFFTGNAHIEGGLPDVTWHGTIPGTIDWESPEPVLGMLLGERSPGDCPVDILINGQETSVEFMLPEFPGKKWGFLMDTGIDEMVEGYPIDNPIEINNLRYVLHGPAVAILICTPQ